jgi:hypothetical protein
MATVAHQTNLQDDSDWKSCLEQINKFDGYLFDLRKYGFTLITGLITAGSFLGFESGTGLVQVGVIVVTMILVRVLFWVDEYYQKALTRIHAQGRFIERKLNRGLISSMSNLKASGELSPIHPPVSALYLGFTIALGALAFFAILTEANVLNVNGSSETPSKNASQTALALTFAQYQKNSNYHFVQEQGVVSETTPNVTTILVYIGIVIVSSVLAINIYHSNNALRKQQDKKNKDVDSLLENYSKEIEVLNAKLSKNKEIVDNIKPEVDRHHKQVVESQKLFSEMVKVLERQQHLDKSFLDDFAQSARQLHMLENQLTQEEKKIRDALSNLQDVHSKIVDKTAQSEKALIAIIEREEDV